MRSLSRAARRWLLGSFALSAPLLLPSITNAQLNVGANFTSVNGGNSGFAPLTPPDSMGAVGPQHWVTFINGGYAVYRKDGTQVGSTITDSAFWTAAGASSTASISDPRIIYDPMSQRYFAVQITTNESTNNRIFIGRTNGTNPTSGNWSSTTFTTSNGAFADYPTMGIDRNGLYVGTNNFNAAGTALVSVGMYSFQKANLLLGAPSTAGSTSFGSLNPDTPAPGYGFTLQAAVNMNPANTTTPVLAVSDTAFSALSRSTLSNTAGPGSATLSAATNISVLTTATVPNGQQPGTTVRLDSVDDRIGGNVYQVGNLIYLAHGTGVSSRAAIRVTVLNATTNAVVAEGTLSNTGNDYLIPSLAVNPAGDIVIGYSKSSTTAGTGFASSYAVVANVSGSSVVFGTETLLRQGSAAITTLGVISGVARFGDYSTVNVDPADPGIFWTMQEFVPTGNQWQTNASEIIPTKAGEVRWRNLASGTYATAGNWFNGVVPGATDHAIYSREGSTGYTVTFAGTVSNDRASVRQGQVTWNLPSGAIYNLTNSNASTPSLAVAEFGGVGVTLTVTGGGTLNTVNTIVASQYGGNGTLTIDGAGTTWNNSAALTIGGPTTSGLTGGTGTVVVQNGGAANITGATLLQTSASALTVSGTSTFTTGGLTNSAGTTPTVTLTNAGSSLVINPASGSFTYSSNITGAGTVTKNNAGTQILTGASNYSGATTINGGSLIVNGSITSAVTINGGTLGGSGTTGAVTLAGGTIAPGNSPGILTTSSITVSSTSSVFSFELGGTTPGTNYDQLAVNGTVDLGGAQLNLTLINSFTPTVGNTFTLINNDLSDLVTNTFAGLPDGALFSAAGFNWQILYNSGTGGNDVVLTSIAAIPEPATVAMMGISVCGVGLVYWRRRRQLAQELNQSVRR